MKILHTPQDISLELLGKQAVVVPTMGNLHDGHLSLIRQAHQHTNGGDRPIVATLFVNRLQFAPDEDFEKYPRTFARDCELLSEAGCNYLFAPAEEALYPQQQSFYVIPDPNLAGDLEGVFRPQFATGVCTIVTKLFNCVSPSVAIFGKKDYQQFLVVREMVRQLNMPIQVFASETRRESSGLAMSSRNHYLTDAEKQTAAGLYQQLCQVRDHIVAGGDAGPALQQAIARLRADGWRPDYLSVHNRETLAAVAEPKNSLGSLVLLAAAHLGPVRLVDNLEF